MKKRIISLFLAFIFLTCLFPSAFAVGGSDIAWTFEDGIITITGVGNMDDYAYGTAPWMQHAADIRSIVISDGITSVGSFAFYNCRLAETISLPDTLTFIGNMAFGCCDSLTSVVIPENVTKIDTMAFVDCSSLSNIYFCGDAPTISEQAFMHLSGTIYYPYGNQTWSDAVISTWGGSFTLAEYCVEHVSVVDPAVAPTCTENGKTAGAHCSICGEVLIPQSSTDPIGHTTVRDHAVEATCTESGLTEGAHCFVCGKVLIRQQNIPALNHSAGDPVIENSVPAEGRYDSVIYCTICNTELSRETISMPHEHTPAEVVTENVTAPTCTEAGSRENVVYCKDCGTEISRTAFRTEALGHTPGNAVVENKVNAGEVTEGSYDSVVYCIVCTTELSRETKIIPATGIDPLSIIRIAGAGRSETAIQAAETLKQTCGIDTFDCMIVASGNHFADALAGSYLAATKSAPILLYRADKTEANRTYILENLSDGGTVYLLGGISAIPGDVENELADAGLTVIRLAGADRYATCIRILEEAGINPGQEILVATGRNFADSLSASATGLPILLVDGQRGSLTDAQAAFLREYSGGGLTILGGTGAICEEMETQLSNFDEITRLSGSTRYETSIVIAEAYFSKIDTVFLASGKNFPDGLCGGPVAYAMNAPMLLTAEKEESLASAYVNEKVILKGYVLGGTSAIKDRTVTAVFSAN